MATGCHIQTDVDPVALRRRLSPGLPMNFMIRICQFLKFVNGNRGAYTEVFVIEYSFLAPTPPSTAHLLWKGILSLKKGNHVNSASLRSG